MYMLIIQKVSCVVYGETDNIVRVHMYSRRIWLLKLMLFCCSAD